MACELTKGRKKVCKDGIGGASTLFLFNGIEAPFTVVDGVATTMNVLLTEAFQYDLEGDGNKLEQDMPSDRNTGTSINTQTSTFVLKKMESDMTNEMNLLAYGYPMAVVKDRNGMYWLVGDQDGIDFQVQPSTGGAKSDLNGYTLVGVSTTNYLAPALSETAVTAFLAIVTPVTETP